MAELPEVDSAPLQVDQYDAGDDSDEDVPPIEDKTAETPKAALVGEEGLIAESCLCFLLFPKVFQYDPI